MEFKIVNLLPENWLNALGTTLFHSLWLGVVLALLSGLVMFSTRKSSAATRYNLLTACLSLFVIAIGVVFYNELVTQDTVQSVLNNPKQIGNVTQVINQQVVGGVKTDLQLNLDKIRSIWNTYNYQIVLIWFLIICAKSIQLLVGVNTIYHLRTNKIYAAGRKWDEKLDELAAKLGVNQSVKILQSGIAQVPMAVGHFKPLILIPLGLLNGLSGTEVEAILAHELAHIKRKDYLVNFLQSFIEIVFFFNPAVLWVSKLIKTEREHCCDDLAIACVNDRKNYVKALIFCQEFKQTAPQYAMAITGKRNNLLHRASRMLFDTKSTLNKMEKTILTLALVSVVLCTAAFKNAGQAKTAIKKHISTATTTIENTIVQDTTKKNKSVKNKEASTSGKNQSAEDLEKAISDKVRAMDQQILANDKALQAADKQRVVDDAKYSKNQKRYEEDQKRYAADAAQYARDAAQFAKDAVQYVEDTKRYAKEGRNLPVPPTPPTPVSIPMPENLGTPPPTPATPPTPVTPVMPPAPPSSVTYSITSSPKGEAKVKTSTEHAVKSVSVTNGDGTDYTDEINSELMKDGIISQTTKLSYKLDKDNLIVNGVKQSSGLHKKYKSKYLKRDNHSLMYNYEIDTKNKF
ncbi:M56 family metallopeptidase [Pedobacter punctiformis]|uniref:M56 family metallopeptidase n=1 Tax=Pedobacter punctiformis TaxID=3004097 RepID=A0ABT4LC55_9SPHI|nr:M56 family metallopeptidase [Pedobacter sp. HCMS5-2]MCZ4244728.1 M56 family metallopeptidase [Pedobacter sp. HCMS5-2]